MAPLIHALEGHPWLSTVVLVAGDLGEDGLGDVLDVFAIGPEAADPVSGPIAPNALADHLDGLDAVVATGDVARGLAVPAATPLVVVDRGDSALAVPTARLHLASTDVRAAELADAGIDEGSVRVVGDPAAHALGELMTDSAGLPNDAMAAVFQDTANWTEDQQRGYVREAFLQSALVDPELRPLLAQAASPLDDGHVGERCVEALEEFLVAADGTGDSDDVDDQVAA